MTTTTVFAASGAVFTCSITFADLLNSRGSSDMWYGSTEFGNLVVLKNTPASERTTRRRVWRT
eukprot:1225366-Rhodomonas_salina.2